MSETIINLFPQRQPTPTVKIETPAELMQRLVSTDSNKAVVLLINDHGGLWETHLATANMSNAEANLALDLVKDLILSTVVGAAQ